VSRNVILVGSVSLISLELIVYIEGPIDSSY